MGMCVQARETIWMYNLSVRVTAYRRDHLRPGLLTWIFALAITVVACSIGWVAWQCIDSLQKQTGRLHTFHATADNTKIDAHSYDLAKNELDTRILSQNVDPQEAIQIPVVKAHGSEINCIDGMKAEEGRHYAEAIKQFSIMIAQIPIECNLQSTWHYCGLVRDKQQYTADAYAQRAYCYLQLHYYKLAIADLNEAIRLVPNNATNYKNRSQAYYLVGQKVLGDGDARHWQAIESKAIAADK